jgi:hypothetical protein
MLASRQKFEMMCMKNVRDGTPDRPLRGESDWTSNVTDVRLLTSQVEPTM